jgi:hypothetical protein
MKAKFAGHCSKCGESVEVGDEITGTIDGWTHGDCNVVDLRGIVPVRPICPNCFLEVSISGDCGCLN